MKDELIRNLFELLKVTKRWNSATDIFTAIEIYSYKVGPGKVKVTLIGREFINTSGINFNIIELPNQTEAIILNNEPIENLKQLIS
ncbi:MAG: hypothetical protein DRG78_00350 [Epsilonproteobacteria bacterium]|nr:MAG: hypothetical protein DRG78_00350 [Campylobacterota bacterium]